MSARAVNYVKPLMIAPNGEYLTLPEKIILLYLADSHNEQERAVWPFISTIARHMPGTSSIVDHATGELVHGCMSERRVRELIQSLVQKGVLWREPRQSIKGQQSSNRLHFVEIDGAAPAHMQVIEQKLQLRGQQCAARTNEIKRAKADAGGEISTESCEQGCEMPQGEGVEVRSPGVRDVAGEGCEYSQPQGCEISQPEALEGTLKEPPRKPLSEPLAATAVEIPGNGATSKISQSQELRQAQQQLDRRRAMASSRASPGAIGGELESLVERIARRPEDK